MKRHPSLQPLSRQHHDGLLAALLLKKGVARNADLQVMAQFVGTVWDKDLEPHFFDEELYLLPHLGNPDFAAVKERLLSEHSQLRMLIQNIMVSPSYDAIVTFHQLLESHIRFEERELFPAIEASMEQEVFDLLCTQLKDHGYACIQFEPRFWE